MARLAPFAAVLLPLALSSCAGAPAVLADLHMETRTALAAEAGLLEFAEYPQTGPMVRAHFAHADGPGEDYAFSGERLVGMVPTRAGRLGCVLLLPPRPSPRGTIIGFHGYLSHSIYDLGMLERLADRGWAAIAVDLPGHGFSDGARGDIPDFSRYSDAIDDLMRWAGSQTRFSLPRPIVLIGHSAGGAAVLSKVLGGSSTPSPDAAVLLAPLIRPVNAWALPLSGFLSLFTKTVKSRDGDDGYLGVHDIPLSWIAALTRWWRAVDRARPVSLPTLIVQGEADNVLEWRANLRLLARKIPAAEVVLLPDIGHVLPVGGRAREKSLEAIDSFLDRLYPEARN